MLSVSLSVCRWISPEVLPPSLGGTGPEVGQASDDQGLAALMHALNNKQGLAHHDHTQPAAVASAH